MKVYVADKDGLRTQDISERLAGGFSVPKWTYCAYVTPPSHVIVDHLPRRFAIHGTVLRNVTVYCSTELTEEDALQLVRRHHGELAEQ